MEKKGEDIIKVLRDHKKSAKIAGLKYVNDKQPGITRVKKGKGYVYKYPDDTLVKDKETLGRIKKLVIPPAWKNVWISLKADGHLQATGRDAKNRKQYKYHQEWHNIRSQTNFSKMLLFAEKLPQIRRKVSKDLETYGLNKQKVLATVVRLMDLTFMRIGNKEYEKENNSYGITTLKDKHLKVKGKEVEFTFKGKSGVLQDISLHNKKLAKIIKKCQDLPGQTLFQYKNTDGSIGHITSSDVNLYLKEISGEDFTAKDFRTWGGTINALKELEKEGDFEDEKEAKKKIVQVIKIVAGKLGNKPSTCKKYYIHPYVFESYTSKELFREVKKYVNEKLVEYSTYHEILIQKMLIKTIK